MVIHQNRQIEKNMFKPKTASIRAWGEHLIELAQSPKIQSELQFWESQKDDLKLIPSDFPRSKTFFEERSISILRSYEDIEVTSALLTKANEAYHTKIEDLLITALLITVCEYAKLDQFCLGLERHGRTAESTTLDVSNTVGWFTSFFPVTLKYEAATIGEQIKSIKEQLRAIPNDGIGYGMLKYLTEIPEKRDSLNQSPQLIFNYLGILNNTFEQTEVEFDYQSEEARDPLSERTYGIEINAFVTNKRLCMNWSYSADLYKEATLNELVQKFNIKLKEVVDFCMSIKIGSYTPSDFPEAHLNQDDLDSLMKQFE